MKSKLSTEKINSLLLFHGSNVYRSSGISSKCHLLLFALFDYGWKSNNINRCLIGQTRAGKNQGSSLPDAGNNTSFPCGSFQLSHCKCSSECHWFTPWHIPLFDLIIASQEAPVSLLSYTNVWLIGWLKTRAPSVLLGSQVQTLTCAECCGAKTAWAPAGRILGR